MESKKKENLTNEEKSVELADYLEFGVMFTWLTRTRGVGLNLKSSLETGNDAVL